MAEPCVRAVLCVCVREWLIRILNWCRIHIGTRHPCCGFADQMNLAKKKKNGGHCCVCGWREGLKIVQSHFPHYWFFGDFAGGRITYNGEFPVQFSVWSRHSINTNQIGWNLSDEIGMWKKSSNIWVSNLRSSDDMGRIEIIEFLFRSPNIPACLARGGAVERTWINKVQGDSWV